MAGTLVGDIQASNPNTNNSISLAKLLKNVEKSYIPGKLLIDTSNFRQGKGTYSDADVSDINDPASRAWGENIRSNEQVQSFAKRISRLMRQHAQSLSAKLQTPIEVLDNADGLTGKKARAKGFYFELFIIQMISSNRLRKKLNFNNPKCALFSHFN